MEVWTHDENQDSDTMLKQGRRFSQTFSWTMVLLTCRGIFVSEKDNWWFIYIWIKWYGPYGKDNKFSLCLATIPSSKGSSFIGSGPTMYVSSPYHQHGVQLITSKLIWLSFNLFLLLSPNKWCAEQMTGTNGKG